MHFESKSILAGGFVVLAVLGAFATWLVLQSMNQQIQTDDASLVDSLATSDAREMIDSGQLKLLATCCCVPDITVKVPLLDSLDAKWCVEKHLDDIHCNRTLPNDVISGSPSEYKLQDGDPRGTLRYAVAFNNQILNYMAEINFGHCFEPSDI